MERGRPERQGPGAQTRLPGGRRSRGPVVTSQTREVLRGVGLGSVLTLLVVVLFAFLGGAH